MPLHDWTRVHPGTFHDFHLSWCCRLAEALNGGLLPDGHYALTEARECPEGNPKLLDVGGDDDEAYRMLRRSIVVHEGASRQVKALIEILSPGNKDGEHHVQQFAVRATADLQQDRHLLIVDVHPAGIANSNSIHGAIWTLLAGEDCRLPNDKPLTAVAYSMADDCIQAWVEPLAVADPLPDMPLFLAKGKYVAAPLEKTYMAAYEKLPKIVKDIIEGRAPPERR
jgi:hypothetical protein